ncbi:MAG TPA: DUF134 domain-containing protein [Firmicutes bacterium]|nr:DUF134 domain-containing protein [Bacillota bacterium]
MSRPRKLRKVCSLPESNKFGPLNSFQKQKRLVTMTIDEYETIRLIDLEGLTQEECAGQMNIARTTVQRIYTGARKKIADSLTNSKVLKIEGGDYRLCDGFSESCNQGFCRRHRRRRKNGSR